MSATASKRFTDADVFLGKSAALSMERLKGSGAMIEGTREGAVRAFGSRVASPRGASRDDLASGLAVSGRLGADIPALHTLH